MAVIGNGTAVTTKRPNPGTQVAVPGGHVTVLLVDPDPEAARLLRDALLQGATDGLRIDWITHVADALERLSGGDIDVVLVAPPLPGDDGVDALARIRAEAANALILPLGGNARGATTPGATTVDRAELLASRRSDAGWLADALRYVTRRRKAEAVLLAADEALFEEKERARVTLSSIGDAVLVTDLQGEVSYLNPIAETMTGWTCDEAIGHPLAEVFDIIDGITREAAADPAQRAMQEDRTVGLEANCVLRRRDGSESGIEDSAAPVHDRHGLVSGAVIVFRDINQSRTVTRKMAYRARYDMLTNVANRELLNERFEQAMRLARRHGKQVALLFVDLDQFKRVNDSLGHRVGDRVLKTAAGFLSDCVRVTDTVCRQGGDEFVILLSEIAHRDDAVQVADKVRAAFAEPLVVDGHVLRISMSIGIGIFPDDGATMEAIMDHADCAMYREKLDRHPAEPATKSGLQRSGG